MRYSITLAAAFLVSGLAASGLAAVEPQSSTLAPSGTLRAVFLGGNPVQGRMNAETREFRGIVPDLVRELARTLDVPYALIPAEDARGVMDTLINGDADIGFLAYNEFRAREVDYGAAYLVMLSSYLVAADSSLTTSTDVDQPGVTVGAVGGQSQEIFVTSRLNDAQIRIFEAVPVQAQLESLLTGGEVDAFAINRQRALDAATASGARLRALPDSFLNVEQSFVVPKGHAAKLDAIANFVSEVRAFGFVRSSIVGAGLEGVDVVPEGSR